MVKKYAKWSELNASAKDFFNPIFAQWDTLTCQTPSSEHRIHQFLNKHSHLFFWDTIGFATVISKLRFGADFISDFVLVYEGWSEGIKYKLVELERPDTPAFTKEGVATARLSRAIQQVLSWKTWLNDHSHEAGRLFPSYYHRNQLSPVFEFEIIIGNRKNMAHALESRRALSQTLGIKIRSFDALRDRAQSTLHFDDFSSIGDETSDFDLIARNKLACPFLFALSDPEWRELIKVSGVSSHFMGNSSKELLRLRRENNFAGKFRRYRQGQYLANL